MPVREAPSKKKCPVRAMWVAALKNLTGCLQGGAGWHLCLCFKHPLPAFLHLAPRQKTEGCAATPCQPAKDGFSCPTGCPLVQFGPVAVKPAAGAGHCRDGGPALCAGQPAGGCDGRPPAQPSPPHPSRVLRLAAAHPGSATGGGKTW